MICPQKEIDQLQTDESKRKYLEKIFEDDQWVRDSKKRSEVLLKYGQNSKEYIEFSKIRWEVDSKNLVKIESYLQTYGYPASVMGENATDAPWLVLHHSGATKAGKGCSH